LCSFRVGEVGSKLVVRRRGGERDVWRGIWRRREEAPGEKDKGG
jgi:hypothetical protein